MAQETKLQYKCHEHGAQAAGFGYTITEESGKQHQILLCCICMHEVLTRLGVRAMFPCVETQESKAGPTAEEFPPIDLG